MTAPRAAAPTAKTIRLVHAAMITGVVLFALVAHFVMRPSMTGATDISPDIQRLLPGVALGAALVSLLLRSRVPRRSATESPDSFWLKASSPALVMWAIAEGAGLLSVFLYGVVGAQSGIGIAAIAVVIMIMLRPGRLEKV
ncbi:MAG TPA: hypothetical protein VGJ18_08300 [Gemmatimonadaceae bacterium]